MKRSHSPSLFTALVSARSWRAPHAARYRLADGGFIENTGAAPAIAAMQKDCAEGKLDCSGPLKIIVVDQLDQTEGSFRLFDFADGPPANGYYQYPYAFGATVPSQQIFAEAPSVAVRKSSFVVLHQTD